MVKHLQPPMSSRGAYGGTVEGKGIIHMASQEFYPEFHFKDY